MLANGYRLLDFDDVSAVYVSADKSGSRDGYREIRPVLPPSNLPRERLPAALLEARRLTARHPQAVLPRWILATVEARVGNSEAARAQLRAMRDLDWSPVRSWGVEQALEVSRLGLLGLIQAREGRCEEARAVLERALELEPESSSTLALLADLDC